ncbi:MAG: ABC transporter substrate-binding protein [Rhodospirillales bacterium]|nr:ABC transporter substrate-binding protein [Rhodospirillales bacterium]
MRLSLSRLALGCAGLALAAAALPTAHAANAPLEIAVPAELSGSGATVGVLWRDAVMMAIEDINAKGGVLGHKLHGTGYDTQTNPSVSRAVIQKALDGHPFAVLGPVYSGSVIVDEALTEAAGVTEIMGGEADTLTARGDKFLFRTSLGQSQTIPPIIDYLKNVVHAKRVAVAWANDDFGKSGHDLFVKDAKAAGMTVVADIPSEVGQVSFAPDLLKLRAAHADAVFLYAHEEENARFLKQFRQMGLKAAIVGGSSAMDAQTIRLAGGAANGVVAFSGIATGSPVPAVRNFVKRFQAKYHTHPDHNAIKGYMAVWMLKAAVDKMGKADPKGIAAALHGMTITPKTEPGILLPMHVLANGDIDNGGYLIKVEGGKQHVLRFVPPKKG